MIHAETGGKTTLLLQLNTQTHVLEKRSTLSKIQRRATGTPATRTGYGYMHQNSIQARTSG